MLLWAACGPRVLWHFWYLLPEASITLYIAEKGTHRLEKFLGYQFCFTPGYLECALPPGGGSQSTLISGIMALEVQQVFWCVHTLDEYFLPGKRFNTFYGVLCGFLFSYWITTGRPAKTWDLIVATVARCLEQCAFCYHPNLGTVVIYHRNYRRHLWVLVVTWLCSMPSRLYRIEGGGTHYFKNILAFILVLCFLIFLSWLVSKRRALTVAHNKYNVVVVQPILTLGCKVWSRKRGSADSYKMIALSESQLDAKLPW